MGRTDRDTRIGSAEQGDRTGSLGAEPPDRLQLGDAHAHGAHDAPASGEGAERDRRMTKQNHPVGNVKGRAQVTGIEEQDRNDPHRLLRVVGAVTQAVKSRGDELQAAKVVIDPAGRRLPK